MLEHGGRLRLAAQHYDTPLSDWLDLSTGINPDVYPVQAIDPACWQRLPEDNDGLEAAAAAYYGNVRLLALPGSQAAIQALPGLFRPVFIACIAPLYEEHPHAWERAGHKPRRLPTLQRALTASTPNVLLCNPNNPTASTVPRSAVLDAAEQLQRRGGWLIVDEAFADAEPENSVVDLAGSQDAPNLIVLRSLGKFFGLAGARVGFIFGAAEKLDPLRERIGPWSVSHPSRAVAQQALVDTAVSYTHLSIWRLAGAALPNTPSAWRPIWRPMIYRRRVSTSAGSFRATPASSTNPASPRPASNRRWKTATMRCSAHCSGSSLSLIHI